MYVCTQVYGACSALTCAFIFTYTCAYMWYAGHGIGVPLQIAMVGSVGNSTIPCVFVPHMSLMASQGKVGAFGRLRNASVPPNGSETRSDLEGREVHSQRLVLEAGAMKKTTSWASA